MPSKNPNYLGKVRSTVNGNYYFPSMVNGGTATAKACTGDTTLTTADLGKIVTNTGASGTVVVTLPAANTCREATLRFHLFAAQILRVLPQTGEAVCLNTSNVVTKYLNITGVIGNYCELYCDGTQWIVTHYSGVVTKEA